MKILNRKVHHDYQLYEKFEAGIVLAGSEVKSLHEGKANLDDAYVKVINGEAFLINAHIHSYRFSKEERDPRQTRKLLLHSEEILGIENKMKQKNMTVVPLALYFKKRKAKLEIALAKGRKEYEKKDREKKRDVERKALEEL